MRHLFLSSLLGTATHVVASLYHPAALAGLMMLRPFRPFGIRESESIMNFSSLGTLPCVCAGSDAVDHKLDRRMNCRECGLEVLSADPRRLDMLLSRKEVEATTRSLRLAGIRARNIDIPEHVRTLEQLHTFLETHKPKRNRRPPRKPNAMIPATNVTRVVQ